MIVAQ